MPCYVENVPTTHRIFTEDGIWWYHVTPETKKALVLCKHFSSPPHKKFKTTSSSKKDQSYVTTKCVAGSLSQQWSNHKD
ncbi:hypothetical protein TNCV_3491961 [Trichonephila clavipes]|nr:hypothetical protein TNCV_3491961 [Trichonephila clavipes]